MRTFCLSLALGALAAFAAACGDDDAPPPATSPSQATTPSAVASLLAVSSTPSAIAQKLAQSPGYFLYTVRRGDTLASVSAAFNGAPGTATAVFPERIRDVNQLSSTTLSPGQQLAIPLTLTGDLSMMPEASLEAALGVGGKGGALVLLQPSLAMRDGYKGRLVLHAVEFADGNPQDEGYGYVMEYWLTDRPSSRGGEADPDARVAEPAFAVSSGSLAGPRPGAQGTATAAGNNATIQREGVSYTVTALRGAQRSASELAAMLQTARER